VGARIASVAAYDRAVIVALDVGNTNVNYSIVSDGEATAIGQFPTPKTEVLAEVDRRIGEIVDQAAGEGGGEPEFVMASVVPAVSAAVKASLSGRGLRLLVADRSSVPMEIRVEHPEQVGDDRLVNAYAALRVHGAPAIVVDMGTATTFDVVDADGAFIGGAIAAGAGLGLQALARGTAQLPNVPLLMPEHAIGGDTLSAMQSGAVIGHSGLVLVLIRAITDQLTIDGGPQPKVILTGGLSSTDWAQAIPSVDVIDPHLTLEGLTRLHEEVAQPQGVPN
jgi:type III pantothenate kinase